MTRRERESLDNGWGPLLLCCAGLLYAAISLGHCW